MEIKDLRKLVKEYGFTLGWKKRRKYIDEYYPLLYEGQIIARWQDFILIFYDEDNCRWKLQRLKDMIEERFGQAQQAILAERTRRDYQVVVEHVRKADVIAGIWIPASLEAYTAETSCTIEHPSGIPCLWADFAFNINGTFKAVLQNDLSRPGMLLEQSVKAILAELMKEQKQGTEGI